MCFDGARKSLVVIAAVLFLGGPAHADFMEGWRAYQRGDFKTALQQWTPLAEAGNPVAQYNVGVMYDEGTGVETNADKVIGWWRKAADQGHRMAQHRRCFSWTWRCFSWSAAATAPFNRP